MFRSWRKLSCETQESISSSSSLNSMAEPVTKKQKFNASECALTGIKITSETSVQMGREKFWAPALLLFSKYFEFIGNHSIRPFLAEAREKSKECQDASPFKAFILTEISECRKDAERESEKDAEKEVTEIKRGCLESPQVPATYGVKVETGQSGAVTHPGANAHTGAMHELNIQHFWLIYLEILEKKLLEHLKLDAKLCLSSEICRLVYNLTLLLHTVIPVEALSSINRLCKTLDNILVGETFWEYNPILLTQVHIWAHEFLDSVFKDHAGPARKHHIALSFVLAQAQHPFPEIIPLSEAQVCDQQLAIRLARNEHNEFEEDAGAWTLNTTYSYDYNSGFLGLNTIQNQTGNLIAIPNFYVGVANW